MGNTSKYLRRLTNIIGIPLVVIWLILAYIEVQPDEGGPIESQETSFDSVEATGGYAVSAAHPKAVEVGTDILQRGGNAYDAAIAIAFTLGVVEPYGSGIGGGGAMVVYDPNEPDGQEVSYIDYREVAPGQLLTPAMVAEELGFDTVGGEMPTDAEWQNIRQEVTDSWAAGSAVNNDTDVRGEESTSSSDMPFQDAINYLQENPEAVASSALLNRAAEMAYESKEFLGTPTPRLDDDGNWITEEESDEWGTEVEEEAPGTEDTLEDEESVNTESTEVEEEAIAILDALEPEINQWGNRHDMEDFGIPGFLMGMDYLYENYASFDMSTLLEQPIAMAEPGEGTEEDKNTVIADSYLENRFYYAQNRLLPSDIPHFFPENRFIRRGDELIQEELAKTMEDIVDSRSFSRYFLNELAPDMVEAFPLLTMEDFQNYQVVTTQEVSEGTFDTLDIYAAPEPLGGPVLIQALQLAELMDVGNYNVRDFMFPVSIRQAETGTASELDIPEGDEEPSVEDDPLIPEDRMAQVESFVDYMELILGINFVTYQDRLTNIGDPGTSERALERGEDLTSADKMEELYEAWLEEQERRESERLFDGSGDEPEQEDGTEVFFQDDAAQFAAADSFFDARSEIDQHVNTSHFVIIDNQGRMMSTTHTLSNFFGSGEYFKGFFLNDQLSNFSETTGSINEPYPNRRPRSFMTPVIFIDRDEEGNVQELIGAGSPGGARIPMMLTQVMINHRLYDMAFTEAIEQMPRFQYSYNDTNERYEARLEPVFEAYGEDTYNLILDTLDDRGYNPGREPLGMYFGAIQALRIDATEGGQISGFADPRRGGTTEGGPGDDEGGDSE